MSDDEIIALPEWDEALNELINNFKNRNLRPPTEWEKKSLIADLIQRFRDRGLPPPERGRGMGM